MHVLIAHADPGLRLRIRTVLEERSYQVIEAADVGELDAACSATPPDVTLLEAAMPTGGGPPLLRRIKSHPRAYATAIVLLEKAIDVKTALHVTHRGAHDVLLEPVHDGELVARVGAAARTKGLQEELMRQSKRLETMIFEDPLTGLYNRRFMFTQLGALVSGARRHERPLSVVVLDIDHFKQLNDLHGHDTGDRALIAAAGAMRERLRAEDYLGRMGGEEFLALLPDVDSEGASSVAESLRRTVSAVTVPAAVDGLRLTVSAGWAQWRGDTPEELFRRADLAMYRAKAGGRDRVAAG